MTSPQSNFFGELVDAFDRHADAPALIVTSGDETEEILYGALRLASGRYAQALRTLGVREGERVLVQIEKSVENLYLYLAVLQLGAVYVPLNTAYTAEEVAYFIEDADPRLFVASAPHSFERTQTLTPSGGTLRTLADAAEPWLHVATASADDLAAIVYTSGTTGRSKGAMLTHGNLASNARALIDAWGWRPDDTLLHALPIFHVHGLFIAMHCALATGTPMIFLPGFDPADVCRWLPRATVLMGVPTFYTRLLATPAFTRALAADMRLFISGSAPLTPQTFSRFAEHTGHEILERYGMSETIINTSNPLSGARMPGTVGFPLPGVSVRITDDEGQALAPGEIGNIEVRGDNVFSGYWRKPEKTAEELRANGFFITGDLGLLDEEGRLSIVGRSKDLVISGGYNVYPKEVEAELDRLPGVVESAVIGAPHADFGEGVVAVVVPSGAPVSEADIKASLADRLARFKHPKQVVNVVELPRNTMGKVQKNLLRERYADIFGAN